MLAIRGIEFGYELKIVNKEDVGYVKFAMVEPERLKEIRDDIFSSRKER